MKLFSVRKVICSIQTRNQSGARSREPPRSGALSRVPIGGMTVPHEPLACSLSSADKTEVRTRSRSTQREGVISVSLSALWRNFTAPGPALKCLCCWSSFSLSWTIFNPERCQPGLLRDHLHPPWLPHRQVLASPRRTNIALCQKTER